MITNRKFVITFFIEEKTRGIISLDGESSIGYNITCNVDETDYQENRQVLDLSIGEATIALVKVPGYRLGSSGTESSETAVFYQFFVGTSTGEAYMLEKRYSEINLLDRLVRSSVASHLADSLPTLPGKVLNPFVDQTSETFIYKRRIELERYFEILMGNHKIIHSQDVMCFFGLDVLTGARTLDNT